MRPVPTSLVIAIGNGLRGDDGAAAHLLAGLGRPAPALRQVQQLTPELSADLAAVRRVLFVDAWLAPPATEPPELPAERWGHGRRRPSGPEPLLRPLAPLAGDGATGWSPGSPLGASAPVSPPLAPAQLLAITGLLFGTAPAAWELLLPAYQLGHGEGLSAGMRRQLPRARSLLRGWCRGDALSAAGAAAGGNA